MRYCFFVVVLLFGVKGVSQSLSFEDLKIDLSGKKASVVTAKFFQNQDVLSYWIVSNSDSVFISDVFNSYYRIASKEVDDEIIKIIYSNKETGIDKEGVINLTSGECLVKFDEHRITHIEDESIFIVNDKMNYKSIVVSEQGDTLYIHNSGYLKYSSLGLFDDQISQEGRDQFLSKTGDIIMEFEQFELLEEICEGSYLVIDLEEHFYIVNKDEKKLFKAKDVYHMYVMRSKEYNVPYVVAEGLDYHDDDISVLTLQKNGKWSDPLRKMIEEEYIEFIYPKEAPYNSNAFVGYYTNGKSTHILDSKGKILVTIEDGPRVKNYDFDGPFLYLYTKNLFTYRVYLKSGEKLILDDACYRINIDSMFEENGYYIFKNDELKTSYIYDTNLQELIEFETTSIDLSSIESLQRFIEKNR